jgi:hypothetical protein
VEGLKEKEEKRRGKKVQKKKRLVVWIGWAMKRYIQVVRG